MFICVVDCWILEKLGRVFLFFLGSCFRKGRWLEGFFLSGLLEDLYLVG